MILPNLLYLSAWWLKTLTDKSLEFYINVVGMVKVREFTVDSEKAKRMGLSDGAPFDIKVLKLENNEQAIEWKLMSFNKKTSHNASKRNFDS